MYHPLTKLLHWLMAALIIFMLVLGISLDEFEGALKGTLMGVHKSLGAMILALAIVRALWWLGQTKPALVKTLPEWVKPFINFGHNLLYAFMVIMPLSGWLMSNAAGYPVSVFGWFTLPTLVEKNMALRGAMGELHETAAWVLIAMLALHIGAAVYHHRVLKDETLTRMLPGR